MKKLLTILILLIVLIVGCKSNQVDDQVVAVELGNNIEVDENSLENDSTTIIGRQYGMNYGNRFREDSLVSGLKIGMNELRINEQDGKIKFLNSAGVVVHSYYEIIKIKTQLQPDSSMILIYAVEMTHESKEVLRLETGVIRINEEIKISTVDSTVTFTWSDSLSNDNGTYDLYHYGWESGLTKSDLGFW